MDLWVVKYASRRSRIGGRIGGIGDFLGDSSVGGARLRDVLGSHASAALTRNQVAPKGYFF